MEKRALTENPTFRTKRRQSSLSISEVITIVIYFHLSGFRNFKEYYCNYLSIYYKSDFPDLLSYNHFLELKKRSLAPLISFLTHCRLGKCTGISFIDSTKLSVCLKQEDSQA